MLSIRRNRACEFQPTTQGRPFAPELLPLQPGIQSPQTTAAESETQVVSTRTWISQLELLAAQLLERAACNPGRSGSAAKFQD